MSTASEKLGQVIGSLIQRGQVTSQNLNGQTVKSIKRRTLYEDLVLPTQVILTKKVPESDAFQADHPVYGELNSDTLYLNSTYIDTPIGHWTLNSTPNDTLNIHNGTETDITYTTGKIGSAVVLNGTSSYINLGGESDDFNVTGTNPVTICAWVYPTTINGYDPIIGKGDTQYHVQINSSSQFQFTVHNGTTWFSATSSTVVTPNTWYWVCGVFDGTNAKLYVNNTLIATSPAVTGGLGTTTYPVWIGRNSQSTTRYFAGNIEDARLYTQSLSSTARGNVYNSGLGTYEETEGASTLLISNF